MRRLVILGALALASFALAVPGAPARTATCQAARVILYTSSDWARLSQGLAADPSPCVQYYVDIAPVAANKTQMRPGAAPQVDLLGPNFHALAEVSWTAWSNWVSSTGNSWYAAGQAARQSMDQAGFNISNGDTWAVNEFPSSVRNDVPGARQNALDFVHGLYDGGSGDSAVQGMVYMIGVGQTGISIPLYKATLEAWFQDSGFWSGLGNYVSDFLYESYGDVRDYALPGVDAPTRIAALDAYLDSPLALVSSAAAPASAAAARTFLTAAYGPLGNASWAWSNDYGWTATSSTVMADYISAQTAAMRGYAGGVRFGFAWNPLNSQGLAASDFATQVGGLLARLAGSIQETGGGDPTQACEATGCSAVLGDGPTAGNWSSMSTWTPTVASFTTPPLTTTPGSASEAIGVQLQTGGVPTPLPIASTVTVSSSSTGGSFSLAPSGPWTPTLTLQLPAGSTSASFFALDANAGTPTITTSVNGATATQQESVKAPTPTVVAAPPPPPAHVTGLLFAPAADHMHVALRVVGGSGQPLAAQVSLALRLGSATVAASSGPTAADGSFGLTAAPLLARGCYSVVVTGLLASGYAWDKSSPAGSDCVTSLPTHLGGLRLAAVGDHMHVGLRLLDATGAPVAGRVRLTLLLAGTAVAAGGGPTAAGGAFGLTAGAVLARGCYSVRVTAVSAAGYAWDGVSPGGSVCVNAVPLSVPGLSIGLRAGHLHAAIAVVDDAGRPLQAEVSLALLRGGSRVAATSGQSVGGRLGLTAAGAPAAGCYRVEVESVSAPGYVWNHTAPSAVTCLAGAAVKPAH